LIATELNPFRLHCRINFVTEVLTGKIQNKVKLSVTINKINLVLQNFAGWVLSSFFYGYIFTQIPGGWIATRFGGKYVFGVGVLVTSVLTLITPQMAYINIWALVAVRVVIGVFEVSNFYIHACSYYVL